MPLEEAVGCLGMLLRGIVHLLGAFLEAGHLAEIVGHLGSWTVRLLSFGYWKPDPESWEAIMLGILILGGLIVAFSIWRL